MEELGLRIVLGGSVACGSVALLFVTNFAPQSWGCAAFCIWLLYALSKGWLGMQTSDKNLLAWGWLSVAAFNCFTRFDPSFRGWGDVYYFCGSKFEYCDCDMRWNYEGWVKAVILWNFVLSVSVAVQKLAIEAGLKGLLPGEEVVTKECFISVCWRLIPYFLNNWEKHWGAECSSMMFELPHFVVELVVILPIVQILCSRLRILAVPGRLNARMLPAHLRLQPDQMAMLAPSIIQGAWRPIPDQRHLLPRLRTNLRPLLMVLLVIGMACMNAMVVPLALEKQILLHPRSSLIYAAAKGCSNSTDCWTGRDLTSFMGLSQAEYKGMCPDKEAQLQESLAKHGSELLKMDSAAHKELVPLAEVLLAILRLSCERFFLLISVFAAYLLFRGHPPPWLKAIVRLNHRLSKVFQKVILYAFPAVCWRYGAGTAFSAFVSVIFWSAPVKRLYMALRASTSDAMPVGLKDATEEQIQAMNGHCTVCWGDMLSSSRGRPLAEELGKALGCNHAFHEPCIQRWVKQCHSQNRKPTCPLCNRDIKMRVQWQWPAILRKLRHRGRIPPGPSPRQAAERLQGDADLRGRQREEPPHADRGRLQEERQAQPAPLQDRPDSARGPAALASLSFSSRSDSSLSTSPHNFRGRNLANAFEGAARSESPSGPTAGPSVSSTPACQHDLISSRQIYLPGADRIDELYNSMPASQRERIQRKQRTGEEGVVGPSRPWHSSSSTSALSAGEPYNPIERLPPLRGGDNGDEAQIMGSLEEIAHRFEGHRRLGSNRQVFPSGASSFQAGADQAVAPPSCSDASSLTTARLERSKAEGSSPEECGRAEQPLSHSQTLPQCRPSNGSPKTHKPDNGLGLGRRDSLKQQMRDFKKEFELRRAEVLWSPRPAPGEEQPAGPCLCGHQITSPSLDGTDEEVRAPSSSQASASFTDDGDAGSPQELCGSSSDPELSVLGDHQEDQHGPDSLQAGWPSAEMDRLSCTLAPQHAYQEPVHEKPVRPDMHASSSKADPPKASLQPQRPEKLVSIEKSMDLEEWAEWKHQWMRQKQMWVRGKRPGTTAPLGVHDYT